MACERNLSERKNARLGDSSYELFYISWLVLQEDKLKARGTHTPLHGLASNSRMASTSPGQWQPWTAVSPLLALRSRKLQQQKNFEVNTLAFDEINSSGNAFRRGNFLRLEPLILLPRDTKTVFS